MMAPSMLGPQVRWSPWYMGGGTQGRICSCSWRGCRSGCEGRVICCCKGTAQGEGGTWTIFLFFQGRGRYGLKTWWAPRNPLRPSLAGKGDFYDESQLPALGLNPSSPKYCLGHLRSQRLPSVPAAWRNECSLGGSFSEASASSTPNGRGSSRRRGIIQFRNCWHYLLK